MPLSKYFGGHGAKVMKNMKERYGGSKGERIFYATHNKQARKGLGPSDDMVKRKMNK